MLCTAGGVLVGDVCTGKKCQENEKHTPTCCYYCQINRLIDKYVR